MDKSDIVVMKFGGSSVSNNENLKKVANKIIELYKNNKRIVVVLSAQAKMTDTLINEAKELACNAKERELDMLVSCGEQMSIAKLSILLNSMNYEAISLTGWQAGIYTDDCNQKALIKNIDVSRILNELKEEKIVIVAGFQGYNKNMDITTLGRGGSDTTAVALAAALNTDKCYIFSDVDGIYTADPNVIKSAKKLNAISYEEMINISSEGAKVLHNRCVEIGDRFNIPIIAKSTFKDDAGTKISDNISENIEEKRIKSIIKRDITRISVIGNGIIRNIDLIKDILTEIQKNNLEILQLNVAETKISIDFKSLTDERILRNIHKKIEKQWTK